MANKKVTRRALTMSIISLILCCAMLVGTTFAWFTDSVTSTNNIIKSGTLDVTLEHKNSLSDEEWTDASTGAIFTGNHWEPGYTDVKYIKISNVGTLAFKFQLNIVGGEAVSGTNLADVIDVYVVPNATTDLDRSLTGANKVGTLSQLMADPDGAAYGVILPENDVASNRNSGEETATGSITYAIALKMQETAGNEYQNQSVGGGNFSVQLLATQYTWEKDSFDHNYDEDSTYNMNPDAPSAKVKELGAQTVTVYMGYNEPELALNTSFQFEPSEKSAENSKYRYWHADFVVKADKDVPANSIALAGYYEAWCGDNGWVVLSNEDEVITAGTEIRLVELLGTTVNYEEICQYGNDGTGFQCGVAGLNDSVKGTTITVELRLYETEEPSESNGNSHNVETGKVITVGTYTYTFE